MKQTISADLCKDTPTITVLDNRGLHVRTVQFNRQMNQGTPGALDTLISHHRYNAIGQLSASADPRFFKQGTQNLTQISSLTGQTLRVDSIDAGWRVGMPDIMAAPHKEWEERGTVRRYEYDTGFHRPTAIVEQPNANESERVAERFVYGNAQDVSHNLNQQVIRHYDNAGLSAINTISLTGQPLAEQRQLLSSLTDDSDWQGDSETAWQANLASTIYTTHWTYNALGTLLSQTDAKGNRQRSEYDVAGYLSATYLQAADATTEKTIVSAIEYNANGQKVHETAGNSVETTYTYDERDWRLMQTCTHRPLVTGRATLLQDLRYQYDPVGNIISIDDLSQARRFYKNQQVTATCQYTYDSVYQLTCSTGRENDAIPAQHSALPPLNDSNQYVNYTRSYQYDSGGNLAQVHHTGASQYTLDMVVSDQSNRAVQQQSTKPITPEEVDGYFDAHGNLKQLENSKDLLWGRHDQLKQVTLTANQQESYQYTVQGNRIRKTFSDTGTNTEREVVYLPGLELRLTRQQGKVSEEQHVVTIGNAGRAQVRLLHWVSGQPDDIPNNQLRYQLDNHLGSSHLELDGNADILTLEEYYPFGGTAVWSAKSSTEAKYKTIRYSGKERDVTGLYYYGYRYYAAWMGRWLNPDPAWTIDGLNLYAFVGNNPVTYFDIDGRARDSELVQTQSHVSTVQRVPPGLKPTIGPKPTIGSKPAIGPKPAIGSKPAIEPKPKKAEAAKKNFTLYRADGRAYEYMKEKHPKGFEAWKPLDSVQARKFASTFTGSKDTEGLPKHLVGEIKKWSQPSPLRPNLENTPKLKDLSTYIKYTKDSTTSWISTAINTDAGGQSSGGSLYEISMDLYESEIDKKTLVPLPDGRKGNMKFSLLTDHPDINQSEIIALNHGPIGDEEISFLTTIPMKYIKPYTNK